MFRGDGVSLWDAEKVLEVEGGDGGSAMCVRLTSLGCALTNG